MHLHCLISYNLIHSFGIVLKEMSCRKHLLKDKMAALDELEYDIEVPAELQKVHNLDKHIYTHARC